MSNKRITIDYDEYLKLEKTSDAIDVLMQEAKENAKRAEVVKDSFGIREYKRIELSNKNIENVLFPTGYEGPPIRFVVVGD